MRTLRFILLFVFVFQFFSAQKANRNYNVDYEVIPNYLKSRDEAEIFYKLFSKKVSSEYQKEKVYVQTNHVFFKPGEELFYKILLVNASSNTPSFLSKLVVADIIDPSGNVVEQRKLFVSNGYAKGGFLFPIDVKGGIYKLRVYTNYMQNEVGKNYFEKELTVQKTSSPRILMKLDFPKKGLSAGEEVLADFSLKNLSNETIPFYQFNYEVFIAGKEFLKSEATTNKDGKIQLKFNLPKKLETTDVLINVKVNYDGFKESISRNVPVALNNVDLFFFPEGGSLVNDISTKIAFKAMNEFGQPIDIKGEVVDENQQKLSEFEAYKFGMGKFDFTPKKGKKYFVKILHPNISRLYELPIAKGNSVVLNAIKLNDRFILKIRSTQNQKLTLVGNFRNKEVYSKEFYLNQKEEIVLNEKDFPSGINKFTVFNQEKIPLCERVIFLNKFKEMQVKITPNKNSFIPREKVELEIETLDENGKPFPANLGLSVIDDKLWTYADDKQNNIFSWLQMDSEIVGKIEEPPFYFKKDEPKADEALDLVMLTNAYRYFELIPECNRKTLKFDYEKSNSVYGQIIDKNGKETDAEVYLIETNDKPKVLKQFTKKGRFYFTDFPSGADYQLVAKSKNRKHGISIKVLAFHLDGEMMVSESELKSTSKAGKEFEKIDENFKERVLEKVQKKSENNTLLETQRNYRGKSDSIKTKDIEQVVVVGYGIVKKESLTGSIVAISRNDINSNIVQSLSGRVAGIEVTQNTGIPGSSTNIRIRGAASINGNLPLFVVDGVIVDKIETNLNTNDIKNISILKDAAATSIYGSRASNGVVIINTNDGMPYNSKNIKLSKDNFAYFDIPSGYLKSNNTYERVFTYPVYNDTKALYRDDFRETIYWNPVIQTNEKGKAKVEFYNSDSNTTFRIITEGISYSGLLGRAEKTYAVKSNLQIDAKIPQYITMADRPEIPLVIKNNSNITKNINLNYFLPKNVEILKKDSVITLKPLENRRLLLPLVANQYVNSNLQISAITEDERETQVLPIKVEPKGFRHSVDFSINKDTVYQFNVLERTIEDNTYYKLRVYKNTAYKILNDLERLLEEPHGCFEQTSSTTYPNYFVLQYLKSKGKVSNELESKAIKNLKYGYNRLVNFETSENGFSLFGSNPANVSLTAFGLMEFNDLKNVINVDEKMIERNKKFVLSKRNPNGTFNLSDYESYHDKKSEYYWAKQAYILYALSSIGIKNEISKQYEVSLKHNSATGDAYQMALLANVAFNLGKIQDYKALTKRLYFKFSDNKLKSETNFMESNGKSLSAEVLALYALALMKSNEEQINLTKIIDNLELSEGYYSTQSKVLVMKALSDFYSKYNLSSSYTEPIVKLNGALLKEDYFSNNNLLKTGKNQLEISYPTGRGLPMNFFASYFSLQPPKDENSTILMEVGLSEKEAKVGDNVRMNLKIVNKENRYLGMITAKIGIPAGLTIQPKLLKDMMEKKQIAYYEIFDNYLVLYWYNLGEKGIIKTNLDLKAEFSGKYIGKANKVYEYYKPENYQWMDGVEVKIND